MVCPELVSTDHRDEGDALDIVEERVGVFLGEEPDDDGCYCSEEEEE